MCVDDRDRSRPVLAFPAKPHAFEALSLSGSALTLVLFCCSLGSCGGKVEPPPSSIASGANSSSHGDDAASGANAASAGTTSASGGGGGSSPGSPSTACGLPAAIQQALLDRWNAAVMAAAEEVDFGWSKCDEFAHPTLKGGTVEAYDDFAAVLLQFFQAGDDFAFLAQNRLFTTQLVYATLSGEVGLVMTFKELATQVASGTSLFADAPAATRNAIAMYLAEMN